MKIPTYPNPIKPPKQIMCPSKEDNFDSHKLPDYRFDLGQALFSDPRTFYSVAFSVLSMQNISTEDVRRPLEARCSQLAKMN